MKFTVLLLALFVVMGLKVSGLIHMSWFELILPVLCILVYAFSVLLTHHAVEKIKKLFCRRNECKSH